MKQRLGALTAAMIDKALPVGKRGSCCRKPNPGYHWGPCSPRRKTDLFAIEDFEARLVDLNHVELYPFKRDRFAAISIMLPRMEIRMKTGKLGLEPGYISAPASSSFHRTIKRSIRYGRAIVAAAIYLKEARMEARGVSK